MRDSLRCRGESGPNHVLASQDMHPFEVPSDTDQTPLPFDGSEPPEQKLPEALHVFDDAKDGLHGGFPFRVERFPRFGLQMMVHRLDGSGMLRGSGIILKPFGQRTIMLLARRRDERSNAARVAVFDIGLAEVAGIRQHVLDRKSVV